MRENRLSSDISEEMDHLFVKCARPTHLMSGQLMPRVQHQIQAAVMIALGRLDADEHIVQCGGGRLGRARCGRRRLDGEPVMLQLLLARVGVQLIWSLDVMTLVVVVVTVVAGCGSGGQMGGQHVGLCAEASIIGYFVLVRPRSVLCSCGKWDNDEDINGTVKSGSSRSRWQTVISLQRCLHTLSQTHFSTSIQHNVCKHSQLNT